MRRTYGQYCPIARSLDVLGERWTLLIVRELLVGPQRYSDLQDHLPGLWSNLLAPRLRDLEAAGLVKRRELPPPAARLVYDLTDVGRALEPAIYELARWGLELLDDPGADVVPLHLLPVAVKGLARVEQLPERSLVIGFALDEGSWVMRVAPPEVADRALDRVTVTAGTEADVDVIVEGSMLALLAHRRGTPGTAGSELALAGAPEDVAAVRRLFGSNPSSRDGVPVSAEGTRG